LEVIMIGVPKLSKPVVAVAGTILAAGLFTLATPRVVHAVAAALVQVTNTASNPVPNSDITTSSSRIVALICEGGRFGPCTGFGPGGALDATPYIVPAGQTLVITDADVQAAGGGNDNFQIVGNTFGPGGAGVPPLSVTVLADGTTHHFNYSRGILFPSGASLSPLANAGVEATLRGYLTAD
jgi:hypothetical protein